MLRFVPLEIDEHKNHIYGMVWVHRSTNDCRLVLTGIRLMGIAKWSS